MSDELRKRCCELVYQIHPLAVQAAVDYLEYLRENYPESPEKVKKWEEVKAILDEVFKEECTPLGPGEVDGARWVPIPTD